MKRENREAQGEDGRRQRSRISEGGTESLGPIRAELLTAESRQAIVSAYNESQPYRHAVIDGLCDEGRLRECRRQMLAMLHSQFKETDLFKVWQTGDFSLLDEASAKSGADVSEVVALRDALYSETFRGFIESVTGCGPLTAKFDCAANAYSTGCHLLCHDDVIGTRRVSYILYLSDPDQPWTAADGGALELYPQDRDSPKGTPAPKPSASLLPVFNRLAFFVVEPGVSFHAVQEVYARGKHRFSIQGWYHAAQPPSGVDLATLSQITEREKHRTLDGSRPWIPTEDADDDPPFSEQDREILGKWIRPVYLRPGIEDTLGQQLHKDGQLLLARFLKPDCFKALREELIRRDAEERVGFGVCPEYSVGEGSGWVLRGPPHLQRYLEYTGDLGNDRTTAALEAKLQELRTGLWESPEFARWLRKLRGAPIARRRSQIRRFRPGLDYTVAHYGSIAENDSVEVSLSFVADAEAALKARHGEDGQSAASSLPKDLTWEDGELGGYACYITADEDSASARAAAEVYRPEEGGDLSSLPAADNQLVVVLKRARQMDFVKYVSGQAPGSRWDLTLSLQ